MLKSFRLAVVLLIAVTTGLNLHAQETEIVEMKPSPGMTQASFHVVKLSPNPAGVLVLVPGYNGSPEGLINNPQWRELAQKHRFDLIGCHFKGEGAGLSYQLPANGSGKLLVDVIKQVYKKDLPMAMYGFSAGAQYASRFIALYPRRVTVWGVYAAGSVDQVRAGQQLPPGVVACGEKDTSRYNGLRTFYNEGRMQGYRWMWLSVPESAHSATPAAVGFIQSYFDTVLGAFSRPTGVWMNLEDGTVLNGSTRKNEFGWLPEASLVEGWKAVTGK